MSEAATRLRKEATEKVLHGAGKTTGEARRAAFDHAHGSPLLDKVTRHAWKVTDEDVAAAKQTLSEDEIYELVICAAMGQATRQLDAALAALDEAVAP